MTTFRSYRDVDLVQKLLESQTDLGALGRFVQDFLKDPSLGTVNELLAILTFLKMNQIVRDTDPCTYICWSDTPTDEGTALTKLGGFPLIEECAWPVDENGQKLTFICQVHCPELLRSFAISGDLIQLFATEHGRHTFTTNYKRSRKNYHFDIVDLTCFPRAIVGGSTTRRIRFDRNLFPTVSRNEHQGILIESLEVARGFSRASSSNEDLYYCANIPCTKICPGYWSTRDHRFFGGKDDLFLASVTPLFQFCSHFPRSERMLDLLEFGNLIDPNWLDLPNQTVVNVGNSFSYLVYVSDDGVLEADYLP